MWTTLLLPALTFLAFCFVAHRIGRREDGGA